MRESLGTSLFMVARFRQLARIRRTTFSDTRTCIDGEVEATSLYKTWEG
ncbi:MAG: hypothetical protein JWO71_3444 [Candidatus Acidoferrum typicum]|nr:hypothetical protein [Candidatus Acidoferrum typicum]